MKFEFILKLKIKRNVWLLADTVFFFKFKFDGGRLHQNFHGFILVENECHDNAFGPSTP